MSFISGIIDQQLEGECGSLLFFDKENGTAHSITSYAGGETSSTDPSFKDYYLAMGKFISKDFQSQYTRKYRLWIFLEALQKAALGFAAIVAVISFILLIIAQITTQGEGWPEWLSYLGMALVMIPLFGIMFYNWFFQNLIDIHFENAYNRELGKKKSGVSLEKTKRKWNWTWPITIIVFAALCIFDSWISAVSLLTSELIVIPLSFIEGYFAIIFFRILSKSFQKLKSKKVKQTKVPEIELSPTVRKQVINHFKLIYQDFQKGKYTDAFNRFDSSQKTRADFDLEIQNFFADKGQALFSLDPFSETETEISISEISENGFEAVLFLYDTKAQEFPEFYLVCQASYQADKLSKLELVELGY